VKDYYKLLEISKDATQAEIKSAYRRLALKYHPDKTSYSGAAALFANINEAYGILSKKESRDIYDDQLKQPQQVWPTSRATYTSRNYRPNPSPGNHYGYSRSAHVTSKVDIRPFVKHFKMVSLIAFILCIIISLDYLLPSNIVPDEILRIDINRPYGGYLVRLKNEIVSVDGSVGNKVHVGQGVALYYSPFFNKLIKMKLVIDGEEQTFNVQVSIFRSFSFALFILIVTSYLGAFQMKNPETIMNFAIVNGLLIILVLAFLGLS